MERNIIVETLRYHPLDLEKLPFEVQDDEELVRLAVSKNGLALEFASDRLRDDYETVMTAVSKNGLALGFASKRLQGNREIALEAVTSNGGAFSFVDEALRKDYELVSEACGSCDVELIPEEFLGDAEIAQCLIDNDYNAFAYLSDELRSDTYLIAQVIEQDCDMLMYVPDEVLSSKESMKALVSANAYAISYATDEIKEDKEIALLAMKSPKSPWAYEQLPEGLQNDAEIVSALVYDIGYEYGDIQDFCEHFNSDNIPDELLQDDAFISQLVELYDQCEFVIELYNKALILRMLELGICNTDYIAEELLDDPDIKAALDEL